MPLDALGVGFADNAVHGTFQTEGLGEDRFNGVVDRADEAGPSARARDSAYGQAVDDLRAVAKYDKSLSFLLDCFDAKPSRRHKISLSASEAETFLSIVKKMMELNSEDSPHKEIKMELFLLQLLLFINECYDKKPHYSTEANEDPRLNEIMKFIQENYMYPISLDMLASRFSFNKYYLCRLFKEKMGFGINDYIRSCRLSKGIQLLQEGMSVSDVSLKTGFGSDTYFISTFKKYFGISPKQYLKKM